jgi:hypothetical protein
MAAREDVYCTVGVSGEQNYIVPLLMLVAAGDVRCISSSGLLHVLEVLTRANIRRELPC